MLHVCYGFCNISIFRFQISDRGTSTTTNWCGHSAEPTPAVKRATQRHSAHVGQRSCLYLVRKAQLKGRARSSQPVRTLGSQIEVVRGVHHGGALAIEDIWFVHLLNLTGKEEWQHSYCFSRCTLRLLIHYSLAGNDSCSVHDLSWCMITYALCESVACGLIAGRMCRICWIIEGANPFHT